MINVRNHPSNLDGRFEYVLTGYKWLEMPRSAHNLASHSKIWRLFGDATEAERGG